MMFHLLFHSNGSMWPVFFFFFKLIDEFRSPWLPTLCYLQALHTQKQGKQFPSDFYVADKLLFCNSSILLIEDVNLIGL